MAHFPRQTLTKAVCFSGIGLHSGTACSVKILPHPERGVFFAFGPSSWKLTEGSSRGDGRCTALTFSDGNKVMTVEHLLGAVAGLGLDGVIIEVEGGEIPAMDGSAAPFVEGFLEAGLVPSGELSPLEITRTLSVDDSVGGRSIIAIPSDRLKVTYIIDYPSTAIGTQCLSIELSCDNFVQGIAPCRTFALMKEVSYLREKGLSLGGSLKNAVVVDDMEVLAKGGLRFPDEFVRHKVLDLMGDISLLGRPLAAHIIAIRAGHHMHHRLAEIVKQNIKRSD